MKVGRFPVYRQRQGIALGEAGGHGQDGVRREDRRARAPTWSAPRSPELIQGYIIARTSETTEAELINTIFPHPTLSETMHGAAPDAYGRVSTFDCLLRLTERSSLRHARILIRCISAHPRVIL